MSKPDLNAFDSGMGWNSLGVKGLAGPWLDWEIEGYPLPPRGILWLSSPGLVGYGLWIGLNYSNHWTSPQIILSKGVMGLFATFFGAKALKSSWH